MNSDGLPDLPDETDVKKRQRLLISLVVLVVIIVLVYAYATNPSIKLMSTNQQHPAEIDISTPGNTNEPIQNWVLQNENRLKEYEDEQARLKVDTDSKIKVMMEEIKKLNQENISLNQQLDDKLDSSSGLPDIPLPPRSSLPVVNQPQVMLQPGKSTLERTGDDKSLVNTVIKTPGVSTRLIKVSFNKKGKKSRPHIRDTVPAGSFGRAVLLSGLDAPTGGLAERNPHPVLLELLDNGNLPNRYRHRVQQCRVVGSGTGNISDERAYIRLERLICILKNGDIISEVATGTITGEDGKNGLRGKLVTKQGQLIANAFWAGALSGIGDAIAQSYTTVSTSANGTVSSIDSSKLAETGLASGIGNTMEKIADWYFKRAEETYPIIEISAGRIVNLFLTEDLSLNANLLANHTPESPHE